MTFNIEDFQTKPIFITGCARSGTSLTAGIVQRCGANGGRVIGPTPYNKRGQYENREIVSGLVKPYLKMKGWDPLGQRPLPDIEEVALMTRQGVQRWRDHVQRAMINQGYESGPWYYKGAKMCLIWPIWADAFPNARWIIVRRADEDIVTSCLKTRFMRAYNARAGWRKWINIHKDRFLEMITALEDRVRIVWPQEMIFHRNFDEMRAVIDWAGLDWNQTAVEDFVEPALWSGKFGGDNGTRDTN